MKLKNNSKAIVTLQNDQLNFNITLAPGELKDIDASSIPFLSRYLLDMDLELVEEVKKVEAKVEPKPLEKKPEPKVEVKVETKVEPKPVERKPEPKVEPKQEPKSEVKVEPKAKVNTNFSEEELNALTKAQIYEIIEKSSVKAPEGDKSVLIKFIMSNPEVVKIKSE